MQGILGNICAVLELGLICISIVHAQSSAQDVAPASLAAGHSFVFIVIILVCIADAYDPSKYAMSSHTYVAITPLMSGNPDAIYTTPFIFL